MMDDVAKLITEIITVDDIGNEIAEREETTVMVRNRSITRSEFYNAAQTGLQPSVVLALSTRHDYNGQKVVEWHGKDYTVIRTYTPEGSDEVELTLEERIQNGK